MNDTSKLENYSELKFSREQGFFDKSLGIRLLIGAIFTLSLFLVLHFREVRVEVLELQSIAPSFIVAQTGFEFLDEESTAILKEEAVRNIGKIYRISDKEAQKRRSEFETKLLQDQSWRNEVEDGSLDSMNRGVDALQKALVSFRFSDGRTIQELKDLDVPVDSYFVFTPKVIEEPVVFPKQFWDEAFKNTFTELGIKPEAAACGLP